MKRILAFGSATIAVITGAVWFLGAYDTLRDTGQLFVCDVARTVGQAKTFSMCVSKIGIPDQADLEKLSKLLEVHEGALDESLRAAGDEIEKKLAERAIASLQAVLAISKTPVDAQSQDAAKQAIRHIATKGDATEVLALRLIADGVIQGGLDVLAQDARKAARRQEAKWRRIGRIAYGVDTLRALDAYKRIAALDAAETWDEIYLGRLHRRSGNQDDALETYKDALARLSGDDARTRSVLLNEIGDVEAARGNIEAAIAVYEKSLPIAKSLVTRFPSHPGFQRDLKITQSRLKAYRAKLR